MSELDDKFNKAVEDIKSYFVVAQAMAKNSFKISEERDGLRAENERLKDLFERIQTWANAYPLTVFPKPDLKKAHKVLKAAGMTLDAISADAMRHVLEGIKDIVEQALKD